MSRTFVPFIEDAVNVYRTRYYIVKQEISLVVDDEKPPMLVSHDTYYERTSLRDEQFNIIFENRNPINGKRIATASHTRQYVE